MNIYENGLVPVESNDAGESPYGFYHMSGNALEWVADRADENYYTKSPERNPKGPSGGPSRVLRGGSFVGESRNLRSYYRTWTSPDGQNYDFGFRCAQDSQK